MNLYSWDHHPGYMQTLFSRICHILFYMYNPCIRNIHVFTSLCDRKFTIKIKSSRIKSVLEYTYWISVIRQIQECHCDRCFTRSDLGQGCQHPGCCHYIPCQDRSLRYGNHCSPQEGLEFQGSSCTRGSMPGTGACEGCRCCRHTGGFVVGLHCTRLFSHYLSRYNVIAD